MACKNIYAFFRKSNNKKTDGDLQPIIVVEVEDIPNPIGYEENDNGELDTLSERITESIAQNIVDEGRDLIVIAIDNYNRMAPIAIDDHGSGGGGSTINYMKLNKITVKYHKESWSGGGSEINIRGFWDMTGLPNGSNSPGDFFTYHNDDEYGSRMKRFKRRWVRRHTEKTLNFKLLWDLNNVYPIGSNQLFGYVIFECDSWSAPKNNRNLPNIPNSSTRSIEFRSWQGEYHLDYVLLTNSSSMNFDNGYNHSVNKSSIKYNFYNRY